jgi:integrase
MSPQESAKPMAQTFSVKVEAIRVDDAIERFLDHKIAEDTRERTMKKYGTDMKRLRSVAGNIYVSQLKPDHMSKVLRYHSDKGNGQGSRNNTISHLRQFCKWARMNGYMSPFEAHDPMNGWKRKNYESEQPPPIAVEDWPILLDLAEKRHPLHRAYFALGLYLMGRGPSEIGALRIWDLARGQNGWTAAIRRVKTRQATDPFAMSNELVEEVARWLTFYNNWTIENMGRPLQREWFVIPRMRKVTPKGCRIGHGGDQYILYPHLRRHEASFSKITGPVLKEYGFPVDDPITGKKNRWGGTHTLRKTGARAWFDELCETEKSRDRALKIVQAALGHKSVTQTEHYLGLDIDRHHRNQALHGRYMFRINDPQHQANNGTTPLREAPAPTFDAEAALSALPTWIQEAA